MTAQQSIGEKSQQTLFRNLTPAQGIEKCFAVLMNETAEAAEFCTLPDVLADAIAEAGGAGWGCISATGSREVWEGQVYDVDSLKVEMRHMMRALLAMAYAVERETGKPFDLVEEAGK